MMEASRFSLPALPGCPWCSERGVPADSPPAAGGWVGAVVGVPANAVVCSPGEAGAGSDAGLPAPAQRPPTLPGTAAAAPAPLSPRHSLALRPPTQVFSMRGVSIHRHSPSTEWHCWLERRNRLGSIAPWPPCLWLHSLHTSLIRPRYKSVFASCFVVHFTLCHVGQFGHQCLFQLCDFSVVTFEAGILSWTSVLVHLTKEELACLSLE